VGLCIPNLFLFLIRRVAKRVYILLSVSVDLSVWLSVWKVGRRSASVDAPYTTHRDNCTNGVSEMHFRTSIFRLPLSQNHLELFRWNTQSVTWTPLQRRNDLLRLPRAEYYSTPTVRFSSRRSPSPQDNRSEPHSRRLSDVPTPAAIPYMHIMASQCREQFNFNWLYKYLERLTEDRSWQDLRTRFSNDEIAVSAANCDNMLCKFYLTLSESIKDLPTYLPTHQPT
jgi:hypothetical protein